MEVCRLCLDLIAAQGEAKLLDGEARDMVQVVAPELNLDVSDDPLACGECTESLAALFEFKSRCFEHEAEVREKVGERRGELTLRDALAGEAGGGGDRLEEPGGSRPKAKDRLCRTCLAPIECESFTVLQPSEPDAYLSSMLDMCLVEVDLELTKDPVMCENCLENLQKLHHFKSSCQDVEDKIVEYCETHKVKEGDTIELHKVLESEMAMPDVEMALVKKEPDEAGTSGAKVKTEKESDGGDASQGDEDMSDADDELKQEEIDIKSEAGTSDSDKEELEWNQPLFKQTSYKCLHCHYRTTNEGNFRSHQESKHPNPPDSYSCHACNYKTRAHCNLQRHITRSHTPARPLYKCESCAFTTPYAQSMKIHTRLKHALRTKSYSCEFCEFKTHYPRYMHNHVVFQHREKAELQRCDVCEYVTKYKSHLQKHIKIQHTDQAEIFSCESCKYTTKYKGSLKRHVQLKHSQQAHPMYQHTDKAKLHHCDICKYTTIYKDHLRKHVEIQHTDQAEIFICASCKYTTKYKGSLKRHIKLKHTQQGHITYHKDEANLQHFEIEYTDELKVFNCKSCKYSTKYKWVMIRHVKLKHTQQVHATYQHKDKPKMFNCESCKYTTKYKWSLKRHVKFKHTKKVCPLEKS